MPFLLAYSVGYALMRALIAALKLTVLALVALLQFLSWLMFGTSATYPITRTAHPHEGTDDDGGGGWGRDSPRAPDPPPSLTDTRP